MDGFVYRLQQQMWDQYLKDWERYIRSIQDYQVQTDWNRQCNHTWAESGGKVRWCQYCEAKQEFTMETGWRTV